MHAIKLTVLLGCTVACVGVGRAAPPQLDLERFQAIGGLTSFARTDTAVNLTCADQSEVQVSVMAPDLIRVRASFRKPLERRDHSWAVARVSWEAVPWSLQEDPGALRVTTDELEVIIHCQPLLIEFRDVRTHRVINADQRPMGFDPKTGAVAAAKRLGVDEHFYGLGEKAAHLDRRRGEFALWTSDTPAFVEGTDPLYQSIPFYMGWQAGAAYGLFFDNSYRTHFDFGFASQEYAAFSADGGEMNYYFFGGPSLKKILGRYADLTGHMPLPPLWALGHQQSRYSYYPDSVAEAIVSRYRADDLPLDVLHLDIHYMNGYRDFTWDPVRFPDPDGFVGRLKRQGVQLVTIVDPGIKYQPPAPGAKDAASRPELGPQDGSYYVFNQGLAQDFFLRRKGGELYLGRVWPGDSVFVDYTKDAAARWWGDLHRAYTDHGVAGIWMDMNEPADFRDKSGDSQADVLTYDGGTQSPYAQNRNVFALNMARATYEGLERLRPGQRPFVITRAGYAGIQRYATMWTGDNTCTWESLALTLPMFESLGLSGEPFVGADIGGFRGRATGELLTRWYEAAFLAPLCRNHAENHSYDHEPWRFGVYYEDVIRKYLKLRYRFLPLLYTTLEESHRTGVPLLRPLLLNYQSDENTLNLDDQYMVGSDVLAAPILQQYQTSRQVYLPAGRWYDFWTGARHEGGATLRVEASLDTTPLFIRGGGVVPLGAEMNYVDERPGTPVALHIYPDASGMANGSLYEDDGVSSAYQQGVFRRTSLAYQESAGSALITLTPTGEFSPARTILELVVHGPLMPRGVTLDGGALPAIKPGEPGSGWFCLGDLTTIHLADGGRPHRIQIN